MPEYETFLKAIGGGVVGFLAFGLFMLYSGRILPKGTHETIVTNLTKYFETVITELKNQITELKQSSENQRQLDQQNAEKWEQRTLEAWGIAERAAQVASKSVDTVQEVVRTSKAR